MSSHLYGTLVLSISKDSVVVKTYSSPSLFARNTLPTGTVDGTPAVCPNVMDTVAVAALRELGTYPRFFARDTTDLRRMAESMKDSAASMFAYIAV